MIDVDPRGMTELCELVTGPVTTLFFTGPIVRRWGFYCPQGWRFWKEFVTMTPGGNQLGRGCE